MSRTSPEVPQGDVGARAAPSRSTSVISDRRVSRLWPWLLRLLLVVGVAAISAALCPFGLLPAAAAAAGAFVSVFIVLCELYLHGVEASALLGGALGALAGVSLALLSALVIARTGEPDANKSFFELSLLLGLGYLGLTLGARKGIRLNALQGLLSRPSDSKAVSSSAKLLDTSALIDGRIAEICEAHFLDGPLLVPQFVLRELQVIADSSDVLRRQRGRRGLEVLQRMQKLPFLEVRVLEETARPTGEVDHELVDLARRLDAGIVTNDFNLNKVATVQGIAVLNVNELANALRPAVLPGESMRVFILREGKEANQGVAYLEDGTMVVVDGGRRLLNKTVDMVVTSVHQTPAGKMIFGRLEDRTEQTRPASRQAAAAGRGVDSTAGERGLPPSGTETEVQ
jgi:uncharacterized protein YacL